MKCVDVAGESEAIERAYLIRDAVTEESLRHRQASLKTQRKEVLVIAHSTAAKLKFVFAKAGKLSLVFACDAAVKGIKTKKERVTLAHGT